MRTHAYYTNKIINKQLFYLKSLIYICTIETNKQNLISNEKSIINYRLHFIFNFNHYN